MLRLLPLAALTAVLPAAPSAELVPAYEKGIVVEVRAEVREELAFDGVTIYVNDQPLDVPGAEDGATGDQSSETTIVYEDTVLAAEDGRRTRVQRSFKQLDEVSTSGEEEEKEGPLADKTLILSLDDEGELVVELEEDAEVEDLFLENHRIEHLVEAYFPGEEVEVGDTWELDDEAIAILEEGGPTLFEETDEEVEFGEMFEEASSLEGSVTYVRDDERDGVACAVLEVEYEFSVSLEGFDPLLLGFDPEENGMGAAEVVADCEASGEGTVEVWVTLEHGRPVEEVETLETEMEITFNVEGEAGTAKIVTELSLSVEATTTWTESEEG